VVVPPSVVPGTPGYGAASIEVISPQVAAALRATVCRVDQSDVSPQCPVARRTSADRRVVVSLVAFGDASERDVFDTTPFHFPITVCCGCLITFPTDSVLASSTVPNCDHGAPVPGLADCALGQDHPVDCRSCAADHPELCQPRGYSPNGATCPR